MVYVCEGVASAGIAADGAGRRWRSDRRAGLRQSRATHDAQHLTARHCCHEAHNHSSLRSHSIAASPAGGGTAPHVDVNATDTAQDHNEHNNADADVCADIGGTCTAGQHQPTAADGAAGQQRDEEWQHRTAGLGHQRGAD